MAAWDAAPAPQAELISRQLLERLALAPEHGQLLTTDYAEQHFAHSSLYQQALAAMDYARGNLTPAGNRLQALVESAPTTWHRILLARCLQAQGALDDAISVLQAAAQQGTVTDGDQMALIQPELATLLFLRGDVNAANAALAPVRSHFAPEQVAARGLVTELEQAIKTRATVRQEDLYDEAFVEALWWRYWQSFNLYGRYQQVDAWCANVLNDHLTRILSAHPVATAIDFGVMCGHVNAALAKSFPETSFLGIDRQQLIKQLNDTAYKLPNMSNVAADIREALARPHPGPTLLWHARTTVLCTPQFVRDLYQAAAKSGIDRIAVFEPVALSRDTLRFYDWETMPDAVAFRGPMILHNYARYLKEAGYRLVSETRVTVDTLLPYDPGNVGVLIEAELTR
jgi:tetratricopeptide (TPR) repeat protein